MPESACAPRIGELSEKLRGLEARREELAAEEPFEREPLTDEDLALLQAEVREVVEDGGPPTRKALLQSLVDEIRVVSRAEIFPSFSLPAVRPPQRAVPLQRFVPNGEIIVPVEAALDLAPQAKKQRPSYKQIRVPRKDI